jgi:hypothetical protein
MTPHGASLVEERVFDAYAGLAARDAAALPLR